MNLDKIIELIAEQVAREVLEDTEDTPDHGDEEDPAMIVRLWERRLCFNRRENIWLTGPCRAA
jgi:hypothetical protein